LDRRGDIVKIIVAVAAGLAAALAAYLARGQTNKVIGTVTGGTVVPRGRVYVADGSLYGPGGVSVPLTEEDRLWTGRMIVGETGGNNREAAAAVTWAIAQNLMLIVGTGNARPRFSSFTNVLRAYAQPINPRWEDRGTEAQIARRARIRSLSWSALPEATQQAVDDFFAGRLENPVPDMVDFAAYRFPGDQVNIAGNWFGTGTARRLV
jgi:hypothetical protein